MPARQYRWKDLPQDRPMAALARRRILAERMMITELHLDAGCFVPTHAHENEQIVIVTSGRMKFVVGAGEDEREMTLTGGEVLVVPGDVPHGAEALEDSVLIDAFSPPSEKTGVDTVESAP